MIRACLFSFVVVCSAFGVLQAEQDLTVVKSKEGVTVEIGGKLFATYLIKSGNKPIVWPIVGPTGKEMTRQFPMREAKDTEKADHKHHRSFWFTHGLVNNVSFWHEGTGVGEIVHQEFLKVEGGEQATIVSRNAWIGPNDETPLCEDVRKLTFGADKESRWIDFDIILQATHGEVKFGDTKEGCFGVRVPGSMKMTAEKGGLLINSHDQTGKDAWGKPSPWVDYYGPVEGETLGIAILNHPSSFRYPTHWHVRTYGLFAANPFGLHNFKNDKNKDLGTFTLAKGESIRLRYRVIFHKGDHKAADIAGAFKKFSAKK